MFFFKKRKKNKIKNFQNISVNKKAISEGFEEWERAKKGPIPRSVFVKEDNSINKEMIAPYIGGIMIETYYMSKETYEIFEEKEREIAIYTDIVQKAVDNYIKIEKKYPIIDFSLEKKINYFIMIQKKYLKEKPPIQFYITEFEDLITHKINHK